MVQGSIVLCIKKTSDSAKFVVPANCDKLWFVVSGAPKVYHQHAWDNDNTNDEQLPYKVKFVNTNLFGYLNNNTNAQPKDVTLTYDVSITHDDVNYANSPVQIDISKLSNSFILQPDEISSLMGSNIKFYALEPTNKLNATITANGYGQWFNAQSYVVNWGSTAVLYSEYDAKNYKFTIGQYPGHVKAGDKYIIKQALVYTPSSGNKVQATFIFNVTIQ